MARTSRKSDTFVPVNNYILKIGLYVRLSNENNGGISETCVENQLQYLERFVKRLEDACIVDVFIDNGQTGTNFNRPEWQRLMKMAARGEINCIVVKDLSRFARSYIDAGNYLDRIFPELGIRLIAVNDNYDSYNILFPEKDIVASFRNLANDYYSKDISRKVLSSFEAKKNNGEFIGSKAPYGYVLVNNHFVIDPPAAKVVKRIFEMRKSGMSFYEIAGVLNKEDIPSPSKYAMENGYRKYKESKIILWQPQAVSRIVYNQVYTGDMITGKYNWSVYSMQPQGKRNEAQWQITSEAHEAIIDRKTFEEINQAGEKNKRVWKEKKEKAVSYENVLKDILVCGKCGHKLRRDKDIRNGKLRYRYYCASGYLYSESECSPFFMVDYKVFEIILEQIRIQIDLAVQMEDVLLRLKETGVFSAIHCEKQMALDQVRKELNRYIYLRSGIYEDMRNGILTKDEYAIMKEKYAEKIRVLQSEYETKEKELDEYEAHMGLENKWMKAFLEFRNTDTLTREMAVTLLERVELYEDRRIHIVFKFRNEYEYLKSNLVKEG